MTTPGGEGPIETAYIEIKPKVDPKFAEDLRKQILPIVKKIAKEADAAFQNLGGSAKAASSSVQGVSRSLNSAAKAAEKYATNAKEAAAQSQNLKRNADGAERSLHNVGGAADAAGQGANRAGKHFNFLARALVIGAVYQAGQALKSLGTFGVGAAAQLEQTKIAFDGLLGSQAAAQDYIVRLQKFAAVTPFDFPGLADAAQRLIAIHMNGDQALNTLKIVGNAAAAVGASGDSINHVVTAIAQIQAKGKLSAEELNQIANALPNFDRAAVIKNLADSFGVTTQQVITLQQKGLIPANAGIEAILTSLQKVPGAMGAMDRQSQTLIGKFSTFKDTIKANFSNALVGALPIVGNALDSITNTVSAQLDKFGPALAQAMATAGPLIEGLVNLLGPLLTGVLNTLMPVLAQLTPALAPIGDAITTILTAFGPALVPLAAALGQLAGALAPIAGELGVDFANALIAVTPLILSLTNATLPFLNYLAAHPTLVADFAFGFVALKNAMRGFEIIQAAIAAFKSMAIVEVAATFATEGLTAALLVNPIGAITAAVVALVVVMVELYRHNETVRHAIQDLAKFGVAAFKFLVDAVLVSLTTLAHGAAIAFGWVPGLGGQLREGARQMDQFRDKVNAALDGITKNTKISVVATYTLGEQKQNLAVAAKQARVNAALKAAAPGGRINELTNEERLGIEKHVTQQIMAENAARAKAGKKTKDLGGPFGLGTPKLLDDGKAAAKAHKKALSDAEKAAKKAATAAHKAAVHAADEVLKLSKATAAGIKKNLGTAEDSLKKLRDQFTQIRDAIRDAFTVDLFSTNSANSFLHRVTKNLKKNAIVLANQQTITDKLGNTAGASDFTKQLFESGNRHLIKSLAAQSSATLRDIVAKFNANADLATRIGSAVAGAYVVGNKPLQVGILSVRDEVIKLRKELVAATLKVNAAQKVRDKLKAANGGIFNSATDLQVGEAGREVVVPLTRPARALELLLKSGALGLPTVTAHIEGLENAAQGQSMDYLRRLGAPPPTSSRFAQPSVQVVKERKVEQTFHIHEAKDPRLTAASVAARTAAHMDR